jgi:hypothetical protein
MNCPWCGVDPDEAAKRHEGPHLTWCVHFREEQRGIAEMLATAKALGFRVELNRK